MKAKLHDIKDNTLKNADFRIDFLEQTNPGDVIYSSTKPQIPVLYMDKYGTPKHCYYTDSLVYQVSSHLLLHENMVPDKNIDIISFYKNVINEYPHHIRLETRRRMKFAKHKKYDWIQLNFKCGLLIDAYIVTKGHETKLNTAEISFSILACNFIYLQLIFNKPLDTTEYTKTVNTIATSPLINKLFGKGPNHITIILPDINLKDFIKYTGTYKEFIKDIRMKRIEISLKNYLDN